MSHQEDLLAAIRRLEMYAAAHMTGPQLADVRMVLRLACTHGHLTQGCRQQSDYGARTCTIYSLRRRGLLDVMDKPTALGVETFERYKTPNADVTGLAPEGDKS